MKYQTTRKAIVNGSVNVKCAGYCDLQNLLRNHNAVAYTAGVYGWNFDVFEVYGLTICTGYRNMPGSRLEHIREYEEKPPLFGVGKTVAPLRKNRKPLKICCKSFAN